MDGNKTYMFAVLGALSVGALGLAGLFVWDDIENFGSIQADTRKLLVGGATGIGPALFGAIGGLRHALAKQSNVLLLLALVPSLLVLPGCASTIDGDARAYGVAEAWVIEGPSVRRTDGGVTTCTSEDGQKPCRAQYAGGWEPFTDAIGALTEPLAYVVTSGAALILGRDELPQMDDSKSTEAVVRFEGTGDVEVEPSRYGEIQ